MVSVTTMVAAITLFVKMDIVSVEKARNTIPPPTDVKNVRNVPESKLHKCENMACPYIPVPDLGRDCENARRCSDPNAECKCSSSSCKCQCDLNQCYEEDSGKCIRKRKA